MKKIFFGWNADKDKVIDGTLSVKKDSIVKSELPSGILSEVGIMIFGEMYIYFDDNINKIEFLFNDGALPDWVKPIVLSEEEYKQKVNEILIGLG